VARRSPAPDRQKVEEDPPSVPPGLMTIDHLVKALLAWVASDDLHRIPTSGNNLRRRRPCARP